MSEFSLKNSSRATKPFVPFRLVSEPRAITFATPFSVRRVMFGSHITSASARSETRMVSASVEEMFMNSMSSNVSPNF